MNIPKVYNDAASRRSICGLLLLPGLLLIAGMDLSAAPFSRTLTFTQPDGIPLELFGEGDEFYAHFETLDGFTVVFDDAQRAYCFAVPATNGTLTSSGVLAHQGNPAALGLTRHLRMSRAARREQVRARYERWDAGIKISERWSQRKASGQTVARGPQLSPPAWTTTGTKVGLCLLIDFDDDPATIPQAEIVNFCNSDNYAGFGNNGSVKKYFQDNSNGLLTYSNIVTIYIRIPNSLNPKSWYNDSTKDCGEQGNFLIRDALNIMKALPNYETGILPAFSGLTVDGNNLVLACNVFYAGGNGGVWSRGLWPHSWSLYEVGPQELSAGGKRIWYYQITDIGGTLELGTFCHENGHMLCDYPDIYDYDYDSRGGAGAFCLMNSGGFGGNPAQICAYLKRASGWATTTELDSTSALLATLNAAAGPGFNHFYRYQKPGVPTEYFLLEARHNSGRDASLPASGVAIWHIDELGDRDNQSVVPNSTHANYEVTLVQADNAWDFQYDFNDGDDYDLYHSGNTSPVYNNIFSDGSSPAANWWDGSPSGINFYDFSARALSMSFSVGYVETAPIILADPLDRTVEAGQTVELSVTAGGSVPLLYQWRFHGTNLPGATDRILTLSEVTTMSEGPYSVVVSNAYGWAESNDGILTVVPTVTLAEAVDTPGWIWISGGTTNWRGQTTQSYDGTDVARSGMISDNQQTWMQTTVVGPGTLTFWWKVSSEYTYDFLRFRINGVEQTSISGESFWQHQTYVLGAGNQVLQWVYTKDWSLDDGEDSAWVDMVEFAGLEGPVTIQTQPANKSAPAGSVVTFNVAATGTSPLLYQWRFNSGPMTGATNASLVLSNVNVGHAGNYSVIVSNSYGAVISSNAALAIVLETIATFSAPSYISVPVGGAAAPYPSDILVSGVTNQVLKVSVTLSNINHFYPGDFDILLVGPGGGTTLLMSDISDYDLFANVTLTFDDDAAGYLPESAPVIPGTYRPTDYEFDDFFSFPAPDGPYVASLAMFEGENPNGTWQLYVYDDFPEDAGSIANGWTLRLHLASPLPPAPEILSPYLLGGKIHLPFATIDGVQYVVEYRGAVDSGIWQMLQTVNGDGTIHTVEDPVLPGTQKRFYRIRLP